MVSKKSALIIFLSSSLVSSLFALFFGAAVYSLLYPQTFYSSLEDSGIYSELAGSFNEAQQNSFLKISSGGIQIIVEEMLSNFFSYLRSDAETLSFSIQLNQEKLNLLFLDGINSLPVCQAGEDPFLQQEIKCRTAGISSEEFLVEIFQKRNPEFLQQQTLDLENIGFQIGSESHEALTNARKAISVLKIILVALSVYILSLILLLYYLKKDSKKEFVKILGKGFFTSGIVLAILGFALKIYSGKFTAEIPDNFMKILSESFISHFFIRTLIPGVILIFIGTSLFLVSLLFKKKAE